MSRDLINIAIILLNWNDQMGTIAAMEAIRPMLGPDDCIVIVDNGSQPPLILPKHSQVEVLQSKENLGFAGGNNMGISRALEAGFSWIMLLNTDAVLSAEALASLSQYIADHPEISILGPTLDEGKLLSYGGANIAKHLDTRISTKGNQSNLDYIPGTCIMIRREVFENVGFLDESYFFSGEIADFCVRAQGAGFGLGIDNQALVQHLKKDTTYDLRSSLYIYYNLRNRFLFIRKHQRSDLIRYYLKWIFHGVVQYIGAIKNGDQSRSRALRLALTDGLMGKFGNQNDKFI